MRVRRLANLCLVAVAACTVPGPRMQGRAEAEWGGSRPARWSGSCEYEVQTKWATGLPHIIRLVADSSEWSIVLSSSRRFPEGRTDLSAPGAGAAQGLVMEGATVRGAVLGVLEVVSRSDSTFVELVGRIAHRDTVPMEAACRLGPIPAAAENRPGS